MTAIVTFIGWHDSGKTTLASQVVHHLHDMGYRVGVIKSSACDAVPFDRPGTDTDTHKQAGADTVLFVGPDQMVLQTRSIEHNLRTLVHRYFQDIDIVIGEGFKQARKVPKIEVVRNPEQKLRDEVPGVVGVATDLAGIAHENSFGLHESRRLAQFIEERYLLAQGDKGKTATLLVNGNEVPMKGFVQQALAGTVAGFVDSLKFPDGLQEIEVRITLPGNKEALPD